MAYTEQELIERVSSKIDEVLPAIEGQEGQGAIEAPVAFIREVIDKAAENIIHKAPLTYVRQITKSSNNHFPVGHPDVPATNPDVRVIADNVNGVYVVPCPTDFLRFVSILLSNFETPVTELIDERDPKYRIQKNNRFRRGSNLKPHGALIGFTDYEANEQNASFFNKGMAIECFADSLESSPTITKFHYIPETKAINMPPNLIDAVCWDAASQTLEMMGQPEKANRALAISERYFGNKYGLVGEAN